MYNTQDWVEFVGKAFFAFMARMTRVLRCTNLIVQHQTAESVQVLILLQSTSETFVRVHYDHDHGLPLSTQSPLLNLC